MRSKLYDMDACLVCGSPYVEWHHVWNASRKPIADREGCLAPLCREHHQGRTGVHQDMAFNRQLRADCQGRWERREMDETGITLDEARERFRSTFYESYL